MAESVAKLTRQLRSNKSAKVRLSAGIALQKKQQQGTIRAFVLALGDSHRAVRALAAAALGHLVDGTSSSSKRKQAITALKRSARRDSDKSVRKQAVASIRRIERFARSSQKEEAAFVHVGKIVSKTKKGRRALRGISEVMEKTLVQDGDVVVRINGRAKPTSRQLRAKKIKGFSLYGRLLALEHKKTSSRAIAVKCKMSMHTSTFPKQKILAFLNGSAVVTVENGTDEDVHGAGVDCIAAVLEDLVKHKVLPLIRRQVEGH